MPRPEEELLRSGDCGWKTGGSGACKRERAVRELGKRTRQRDPRSWYAGEEGGTAIAQTLSGKNNPAGRLPVTFYTGIEQLPPFEDYGMKGRTYRYLQAKPLYPFGYGLSYTRFSYRALRLLNQEIKAGDPLSAEVTVTNKGKRGGDEVVQLYISFPNVPGAPLRALRGFKRIHLEQGQSARVRFDLKDRDLSMVTETGEPIIAEGIIQYGSGVDSQIPAHQRWRERSRLKVQRLCRSRRRRRSCCAIKSQQDESSAAICVVTGCSRLSLSVQTKTIGATIDVLKASAPIATNIYGQFLEHIGGIVNNAIWAEMLETGSSTIRSSRTRPPDLPLRPVSDVLPSATGTPTGQDEFVRMDSDHPYRCSERTKNGCHQQLGTAYIKFPPSFRVEGDSDSVPSASHRRAEVTS